MCNSGLAIEDMKASVPEHTVYNSAHPKVLPRVIRCGCKMAQESFANHDSFSDVSKCTSLTVCFLLSLYPVSWCFFIDMVNNTFHFLDCLFIRNISFLFVNMKSVRCLTFLFGYFLANFLSFSASTLCL